MVNVTSRGFDGLRAATKKEELRFGLSETDKVMSCYEAGRDGFWIHRLLSKLGVDSLVVDSSSIEVSRRKRRAKTDRLDAIKLVALVVRHARGEKVWSVVRVPAVEDEDIRGRHREIEQLKKERGQPRKRIQSLLFAQGVDRTAGRGFREQLEKIRL